MDVGDPCVPEHFGQQRGSELSRLREGGVLDHLRIRRHLRVHAPIVGPLSVADQKDEGAGACRDRRRRCTGRRQKEEES